MFKKYLFKHIFLYILKNLKSFFHDLNCPWHNFNKTCFIDNILCPKFFFILSIGWVDFEWNYYDYLASSNLFASAIISFSSSTDKSYPNSWLICFRLSSVIYPVPSISNALNASSISSGESFDIYIMRIQKKLKWNHLILHDLQKFVEINRCLIIFTFLGVVELAYQFGDFSFFWFVAEGS